MYVYILIRQGLLYMPGTLGLHEFSWDTGSGVVSPLIIPYSAVGNDDTILVANDTSNEDNHVKDRRTLPSSAE